MNIRIPLISHTPDKHNPAPVTHKFIEFKDNTENKDKYNVFLVEYSNDYKLLGSPNHLGLITKRDAKRLGKAS